MRVSISVLDTDLGFDVTVSANLPVNAYPGIKRVVRTVVDRARGPAKRTGLLARLMTTLARLHDCEDSVEISTVPNYEGYVVTISLVGERVITQCFAENGVAEYTDFADLDGWVLDKRVG